MVYHISQPGVFITPDDCLILERFLSCVDRVCLSDEDQKYLHDLIKDLKDINLSFTFGIPVINR